MNINELKEKIEKERRKLHQLIGADAGAVLSQNRELLKQSRKVEALIARLQKKKYGD